MMNEQQAKTTTDVSIDYDRVTDEIFSCVNNHLILLVDQMVNSADRKLFDLAEKAKTDEERMKFMDCTRIFRTEKNDISHHYFINLNNKISNSANSQDSNDSEELSLVDQDEMEEMVAITTMHAKAMNIYGEEVSNMEARLEYLELMCEHSIDKESLDPKHLCEVFQSTIENIEIDVNVKLVFYKLFDQEVCSKLGIMYKAINQVFIDNDIMPRIVLKTTKQEEIEQQEVSTQVANYYDPTENVSTSHIPRSNNEISRIANEFMNGEMTITGEELHLPESFTREPTQNDIDGKNCYQRKDVLKALSSLQKKINALHNEGRGSLTTEQITQEVISEISKENGGMLDKQVNLLHQRSIDFVGMMFTAICDDETVSEIMTSLINQLQVPVMKISMIDENLFEDEKHPARETVDLLTVAGKGINSKQDRLYDDLENIVDGILDRFDDDLSTFEQAVDELEKIIAEEEKHTTETERLQQRKVLQEHARDIVIKQIKQISSDKRIPNNIRPLILKHWSTLMLNRYIRYGRDSSQWLQSLLLMKLLLRCVQPINDMTQYKVVKNNHLAILEALNDELYQTQQDKEEINTQIDTLKFHFIEMIENSNFDIVDEEGAVLTREELLLSTEGTEEELKQIQQQHDMAKEKIAQLENSTRPGAWYEIYDGDDKPIRRLKLSVILTDAAQLVFVDRKGIKVIEKDAEEFAIELKDRRSRLLADHSTFDQALGNVINALAA